MSTFFAGVEVWAHLSWSYFNLNFLSWASFTYFSFFLMLCGPVLVLHSSLFCATHHYIIKMVRKVIVFGLKVFKIHSEEIQHINITTWLAMAVITVLTAVFRRCAASLLLPWIAINLSFSEWCKSTDSPY